MSGRYLSFAEREDIAIWRAQKLGVREIARRLGRSVRLLNQTRAEQKGRGECQQHGADLEPNHGRAGTGEACQYGQGNQKSGNHTVDPLLCAIPDR